MTTLGRIRPRCGYPGRVAPTGAIVPGMRDEHHDVVRLPASASGAPCRRSKRSCNAGEVAPCQASEWAKVAQAAVSCATRAAAALDAPHSRTICAIMRLIAVRARPVASTDRLHRRQHRLARVAPSSWLDSQQHLIGAHPAAPQDLGILGVPPDDERLGANGPRLNGGTRRNLVRAALQTAPPTSVVSGSGRYTGARDQVCQLIFSHPVHVR